MFYSFETILFCTWLKDSNSIEQNKDKSQIKKLELWSFSFVNIRKITEFIFLHQKLKNTLNLHCFGFLLNKKL